MKDYLPVKYLIIGADGLVGSYLARIIKPDQYAGTCFNREIKGLVKMDLLDYEQVGRVVDHYRPETIFYCANLAGGINLCEQNPEKARAFHYDATVNLAQLCKDRNIGMVFISSEAVFPDSAGLIDESAPTGPLNIYGLCKRDAEAWIVQNLHDYIIVRTINVYGWDIQSPTPNFIMQLYKALCAGQSFKAASYLKGSPTYVEDLAGALLELAENRASGIFHIVGPDYIDRYSWAQQFAIIMGLDRELIVDDREPAPSFVSRPMNIILDTGKFTSRFSTPLRGVAEGLKALRETSASAQQPGTDRERV